MQILHHFVSMLPLKKIHILSPFASRQVIPSSYPFFDKPVGRSVDLDPSTHLLSTGGSCISVGRQLRFQKHLAKNCDEFDEASTAIYEGSPAMNPKIGCYASWILTYLSS